MGGWKTILYKNNFEECINTLALKTHFKAGCKNFAIWLGFVMSCFKLANRKGGQ